MKFIALSFSNEDEFAVLLQYKLSDPDSIIDIKLFEYCGAIYIARSNCSKWSLERLKIGPAFKIVKST